MPAFHPEVNFKDQKQNDRSNCNTSVHGLSSLKKAELSTFVNHAEVQYIINRILLEAPVSKAPSKAPSKARTSLTSVGAH